MRRLVAQFLTEADRNAIRDAVRAAEAQTSAEIVPMIVGASDSYPKAQLACAVTVGLVCAVLACLVCGTRNMWAFLAFFGVFALLGFQAAKRLPALMRPFVSPARASHETLQAAQAAFFSQGLTQTRERNALLVYVSVFERLVFLLPDTGLAGKIDARELDAAATALSAGIRKGRPAEAIAAAVACLAHSLAAAFPPRTDDVNEIKDLILF